MGNGSTQCVLCGEEFGLLGASLPSVMTVENLVLWEMDQPSVFSVEMSLVY